MRCLTRFALPIDRWYCFVVRVSQGEYPLLLGGAVDACCVTLPQSRTTTTEIVAQDRRNADPRRILTTLHTWVHEYDASSRPRP